MICLYLCKRNLASPHLNDHVYFTVLHPILTTKSGDRHCLHVKTLKTSMMAFFSFVLCATSPVKNPHQSKPSPSWILMGVKHLSFELSVDDLNNALSCFKTLNLIQCREKLREKNQGRAKKDMYINICLYIQGCTKITVDPFRPNSSANKISRRKICFFRFYGLLDLWLFGPQNVAYATRSYVWSKILLQQVGIQTLCFSASLVIEFEYLKWNFRQPVEVRLYII